MYESRKSKSQPCMYSRQDLHGQGDGLHACVWGLAVQRVLGVASKDLHILLAELFQAPGVVQPSRVVTDPDCKGLRLCATRGSPFDRRPSCETARDLKKLTYLR